MNRTAACCLACLAGLTALPSLSQQSGTDWVRRMQRAEERAAFSGVRVTRLFFGKNPVSVEESVLREGPRLRVSVIKPPDRARQVMLDNGVRVYFYNPKENIVRIMPSDRRMQWWTRHHQFEAIRVGNITVRVEDTNDPVAGRRCVRLSFSNTEGLLRRRIWVDEATAVPLRVQEFSPDAKLRMEMEFIRFRSPYSPAPGTFEPDFPDSARREEIVPPFQRFISVDAAQPVTPYPIRQPRPLPATYRLVEVSVRAFMGEVIVGQHFTNDTYTVALFQSPDKPHLKGPEGMLRKARGQAIWWKEGGMSYSVLGDAPPKTLEAFRNAVR